MMRKPVLTIFYQFNPWNSTIGGIQTLIRLFIKYAPNDFEVRLVGTGDKGDKNIGEWQEAVFAGRPIKFLPLFALENDNVRNLIPTTVKYTAALLGRNFASDFMHFHRLEPTLATWHWQGEKTLFIHNDIHAQMKAEGDKKAILWRRFPKIYFALESLLVRQFNQILSCNTKSAQFYQQHYPNLSDRIAYIKNSFDDEVFYPLHRDERASMKHELARKFAKKEQTKFILFAGRLHPQKDPVLLVQALSVMKKQLNSQSNEQDVHLLIVGEGELAPQLRDQIDNLGLTNSVTMLGALNQAELADLHRVCDVFALSSAYEGLPLVALEALACGTPVVTTQTGETPLLLTHDSGVVCNERTPECIASALHQVLSKSNNFSQEACTRVARPYAARTVVNEVFADMLLIWSKKVRVLQEIPTN
ncbi:glycosyl transferase [Dulcicalothrix desertica PCC 7102]|uniref:Glycosyl transferase n=2 Tax=Dulcicalothrix desertica TaxID=32056 RepID=A0A433VFF0_9CYAN|nr:glycosyl transferase [Dulcicalothrix desertica PCC 7102]TWH42798.1 glycosyltransferase involved in cell wall biosynthesis [Dulcicalothrix desertica PCC 7102]